MLKQKESQYSRQSTVITPELLAGNSFVDYQGINWNTYPREDRHRLMMAQITPFFNCLKERPIYLPAYIEGKNIMRFSRFVRNSSTYLRHSQLHQGCQATSENTLVYLSRNGVSVYNMISQAQNLVLHIEDPYTLSLNRKFGLIAGTSHKCEFFLCDLKTQKLLHKGLIAGEEQMTNRTLFFDNGLPLLAVAGNHKEVSVWDIERIEEAYTVPSIAYVNDLDYSDSLHAFAFAMDDLAIEVKDDRFHSTKKNDLRFEGHLDYNLAVKFLSDHQLASGGQDCSTRIWDIRQPQKELFVLGGNSQAVCAFAYKKEADKLFCCENVGSFYGYDLSLGQPRRESFSVFGYPAGICMTPSERKLVVPIAEFVGGFMEFTI